MPRTARFFPEERAFLGVSDERPHLLLPALYRRGLDIQGCAKAVKASMGSVYAWDRGTRCPEEPFLSRLVSLIGREEVRALIGPGKGRVETGRPLARSLHSVDRALRARGQHELAQLLREAIGT